MKTAIGILTVIVVAMGWQLAAEKAMNNQLRSQLVELTSELNDKSVRENLELQEKCATQAEKVFRELGYNLSKDLATNQSHFNAKFNKCFMSFSVTNLKGGYSQSRYLIDAYEQRGYAELFKMNSNSMVMPTSCSLTPLAEKESSCKSESEYNEFVARYME